MFTKHHVLSISLLFITGLALNAEKAVHHITPPNLDGAHLGKKVLCHRPMREGAICMDVSKINKKLVANNYGHGGSGWTLAPGCANYVNNLLINSDDAANLKHNTPIAIIGAGVIGLFTAYDLLQKGFTNITIYAHQFENLTSHNAGGLLAPVSMSNAPEIQALIDVIGTEAYKFYALIAQKTHPDFSAGAVIVPTYFQDRENSGLEPYVGQVMQPAEDIILDFGNGTTQEMVCYPDGIFIDTATMMVQLNEYAKNHNVRSENS